MTDLPRLEGSVLIADDEEAICRGIKRVLTSRGAEVDMAHSGADALKRLTSTAFDVALVDLVMPSFGGFELLERIEQAELKVVAIVITAHASIDTAVEAIRKGAFDYLPKPFAPEDLVLRVHRALAWRHLRREAETRLLELNSDKTQLRTILNSLADGVIVVNVDGRVVLTNPAVRAALGLGPSPHDPQPLESVVADPALAELIRRAPEVGPGGRASLSTHVEVGQHVYMARVVPIEDSRKAYLGSATVLRDVTELMSLERAKSRFMSMVAHELKSPLAAVQGYLNVVLGEAPPDDGRREEVLTRCRERVEGMAELVRDLLELSRSEAPAVRRTEELAVADIVTQATNVSHDLAERHEVSLEVQVAPDCPPLHADRAEVVRILTNLVSNAIKYNRPGGRVSIRAVPDSQGCRLDVEDDGLGIPEDALPRLGEEFFRVNTDDRRGIVGTGLGLALVRRAVAANHGRLAIRSVLGQGSVFSVWLPSVPGVNGGPGS
ncbi:MAG TPA: response regulator [Armatimonadota bacterium]|nr:response regulator [Armatimonadota bacterium]